MTEDKRTDDNIIGAEEARGARSARATSLGDTLVPMLVAGLILVVIGMGVVMLFL